MSKWILHLETATQVCSVALSNDGNLVAIKETLDEGYVHGEKLNLFIQDVLAEAGITLSDLAAVSLASGPGSYTGLRIGAATAKGLCYALQIPLIAVDALRCLVELASEKYPGMSICAAIDARRMEVYSLIANAERKTLKAISADIIEAESYAAFEPFVCVGDGAEKLREIWSTRAITLDATCISSARGQIRLAWERFQEKKFEDVAYWEPFYLKDFIAGTPKA
jgi:tRNA threonylcarbamoyladenosine biosynthesis protein TsaB